MIPLLELVDVEVHYGGVQAVAGVNLTMGGPSILGVIGPNGAGKTSLVDAITGFASYRGRISFAGRTLEGLGAAARAQAGLRRTFQQTELFDDLTVRENVELCLSDDWGRRRRERDSGLVQVDRALARAGISALAAADPRHIAFGLRRLVDIARATVSRPKLVVMDEPAAGLDSAETADLGRLLVGLRDEGMAVLLVDHDTDLVFEVCDQVVVLDFGAAIAQGTPAEVMQEQRVIDAYLGVDA